MEDYIRSRSHSIFINIREMEIPLLNKMSEETPSKRKSKIKYKKSVVVEDAPEEEAETEVQKIIVPKYRNVFLYMNLQEIINVPKLKEIPLKIRLSHTKGTISKMTESNDERDIFDVTELEKHGKMPTFSLIISQDSLVDINLFSDTPLSVVLYRTVKERVYLENARHGEGEEEDDDIMWADHLEPIGQGYIDLLEFFTNRRSMSTVTVFLYPFNNNRYDVSWPTCKTTWIVYSIMPLLKSVAITNVIFITVESIYNPPPELLDIYDELIVDLSFRSKNLNENMEHDKHFLCSHTMLGKSIIAYQNINFKWESLKSEAMNNTNSLAIQSGCKVNISKLFCNLLGTEDVNFRYNEIRQDEDLAIICNALHRFVLTQELSYMFEEMVAFDQYHIYVEIYSREKPDDIIMTGVLDLQILLYPLVNSCRFAVELRKTSDSKSQTSATVATRPTVDKQRQSKRKTSSKASAGQATPLSVAVEPATEKPTFIIINICLINPITGAARRLSKLQDKAMEKERLQRCNIPFIETLYKTTSQVCEETYKSFDQTIRMMFRHMVMHKINQLASAKNYFCCQLDNISNLIIKLIACDFNLRYPTKTNLEFSNLITVVYKELTQRVYDIASTCDNDNVQSCYIPEIDNIDREFFLINMMKHLYETGEEKFYKIFEEKLHNLFPESAGLNFVLFLYDVEKGDFDTALNYTKLPLKLKKRKGEYYAELVVMYISYMQNMSSEATQPIALETLLNKLKRFTERYPKDADGWVMYHCIYASCNYLPGMAYTRKRYEELYDEPPRELLLIPKTRWEMYNAYEIKFTKPRDILYYRVLQMFNSLGMYRFAEMIFDMIAANCSELERHLMVATFKILLNTVDAKYPAKNFAVDRMPGSDMRQANLSLANGNLEFSRFSDNLAMSHYARLFNINFTDLQDNAKFQMAFMRYANHMYREGNYEEAGKGFDKCCSLGGNCLIAQYGMGRALYRLGRLEEADLYLCSATRYGLHVPDIWGFLALVNLKLGRNFKALEFWKYAKLKRKATISEEVYEELAKINKTDVDLYVDVPEIK